MKLVIQIPCWNEEDSIGEAVSSLPKQIDGVDSIDVVVVDDGSTDRSAQRAREAGATHVIHSPRHRGLAATFSSGVDAAIARGADILVNTDADLQYRPEHIPDLVKPIIRGEADIVIGDRLHHRGHHFSLVKLVLQRFGSFMIRVLSGVPVRDAASGFRALSREVLQSMYIRDRFSYTLESLILAGMCGFRVANVPISTNPPHRKSRLFRSIPSYLTQSAAGVLRAYLVYHPLRFFAGIGSLFLLAAVVLGVRFLVFYFQGEGGGHIQSLILLSIFTFLGFQCVILGLVGDLLSANRRLLERMRAETTRDRK